MKVGIVGSESAKFTKEGEQRARIAIRGIYELHQPEAVVSGHCHLGGIDIWAEEEADNCGVAKCIYPPATHSWSMGYKPRNLKIAETSDVVYVITVNKLPDDFKGMKFNLCYHCAKNGHGDGKDHVKSGGCWTAIQAEKMGKEAKWIIIQN